MSWSLNVSGHIDADPEVAERIEQAVLEKVKESISVIRAVEGSGVANATFIGHFVGPHKVTSGTVQN
ncbi:MAG TPA: hypothetical protein VMU94_21920 [Streptosporangiaceae bacterium]|nr:hypothetical protein [Streptosporangiaceae bacterium]